MKEFVLMGRGGGGRAWLVMFVPGLLLVALGVLIVVVPKLLVAMVAAIFIVAGLGLASMGWRLRSLGRMGGGPLGGGPLGGGMGGFGGVRPPGAGGGPFQAGDMP